MLLGTKSGNIYIVSFNENELDRGAKFNFMSLSILGKSLPADLICKIDGE